MQSEIQKALTIWTDVMIGTVRDEAPDLSARQLALMLLVYNQPGRHTVKSLAIDLNISKPAVTRALDSLGRYGLVKRLRDENDRRNVLVGRTPRGLQYVNDLADRLQAALLKHPAPQSEEKAA